MGWKERPQASAVVQRDGEMPMGRGEDELGVRAEVRAGVVLSLLRTLFAWAELIENVRCFGPFCVARAASMLAIAWSLKD